MDPFYQIPPSHPSHTKLYAVVALLLLLAIGFFVYRTYNKVEETSTETETSTSTARHSKMRFVVDSKKQVVLTTDQKKSLETVLTSSYYDEKVQLTDAQKTSLKRALSDPVLSAQVSTTTP
jgi:hypothetical protein